MKLGERIIKLRKENKLSQEKLSEKLNITRQTLSNYENDITVPDIETANKLSKTLNISLDELLGNDLSFVENKLNTNEKLAKKSNKLLKIILITIYFLILILAIIVMVYYFNKKDFTTKYQPKVLCYIKEENGATRYQVISLEENIYECPIDVDTLTCKLQIKDKIKDHMIVIEEYLSDSEARTNYYGMLLGGNTIYDAFNTLNTIKNTLIEQGYKCK